MAFLSFKQEQKKFIVSATSNIIHFFSTPTEYAAPYYKSDEDFFLDIVEAEDSRMAEELMKTRIKSVLLKKETRGHRVVFHEKFQINITGCEEIDL